MIYLDSSVVLAELLSEDRSPAPELWEEDLASSRLLEFEVWNRIFARKLARSHDADIQILLGRVSLLEMSDTVLTRALEPFPVAVRTLDALHLATMEFLRAQQNDLELATYDRRLAAGARALGIPLVTL